MKPNFIVFNFLYVVKFFLKNLILFNDIINDILKNLVLTVSYRYIEIDFCTLYPGRGKRQPTPIFLSRESPWTEAPGRLQSMRPQESDTTSRLHHHHHHHLISCNDTFTYYSSRCFVDWIGVSKHSYVLYKKSMFYFFSFPSEYFIFSCLILLGRTSNTVLNRYVESGPSNIQSTPIKYNVRGRFS